jgi:superfamily I DNA/RNA helicase
VSSESDQVAELIAEEHDAGRPYRDCAILVRANHDADAFLRALNLRGIPWTFSGNAVALRPKVRLLIVSQRGFPTIRSASITWRRPTSTRSRSWI